MPHSSEFPPPRPSHASERKKREANRIGMLVGAMSIFPEFKIAILHLNPLLSNREFMQKFREAASEHLEVPEYLKVSKNREELIKLKNRPIAQQIRSLQFSAQMLEAIKDALFSVQLPRLSVEEQLQAFAAQLDRQVFGRKTPRKG